MVQADIGSTDTTSIFMQSGPALRVEGTVYANDANSAVDAFGSIGTSVTVTATGRIFAQSQTGTAGIYFGSLANVDNAGTLECRRGTAMVADGNSTVTNTGQIVTGEAGVVLSNNGTGGAVFNSGLIRAGTSLGGNSLLQSGVVVACNDVSVINTGTIITQKAGFAAVQVTEGNTAISGVTIDNAGTLTGPRDYGIDAGSGDSIVSGIKVLNTGLITGGILAIRGSLGGDTVTNFGTITMRSTNALSMDLNDGVDVLVNNGVINGSVALGFDADRYNGRNSTAGADINGGAGTDDITGGAFNDTLRGGADSDFLSGGAGDDELSDFGGDTTVYGGAGDDAIGVNGGTNLQFGGAGDDNCVGATGVDQIYGGAGDDTLTGLAGNDIYGVNTPGDVVTEGAAGGMGDRVQSGSVSLNLNLFANVENATLTGVGALALTGSAGAKVPTGNVAGNRIAGGWGPTGCWAVWGWMCSCSRR